MGKFDVFDIELTKREPYLSGDVVGGSVLLKSKKEMQIARIMIHLYGGGRVVFTMPSGPQAPASPSEQPTYQDSQTYLSQSQVLLDRQSLAKGKLHRLNFELPLPSRLPSSYMTVVTYSITALVDRGAVDKSCTLTRPLVVVSDVDLNHHSPGGDDLWRPLEAWGHWRCCASQQQQQQSGQQKQCAIGLLTVRLLADKRGFAIGESLGLSVEVRNNTKARLESVRVCLTQKATLRAAAAGCASVARQEQRLAVQHSQLQARLKPGASLIEDRVQLPVPWLATAAASAGCRLLKISYCLQVVCAVTPALSPVTCQEPPVQTLRMRPKFDRSEQVMVLLEEPVIIGTRPLEAPAVTAAPPAVPPRPSAPPRQLPSAPELLQDLAMFTVAPSAPPSYEESMMAAAAQLMQSNYGAASADDSRK